MKARVDGTGGSVLSGFKKRFELRPMGGRGLTKNVQKAGGRATAENARRANNPPRP